MNADPEISDLQSAIGSFGSEPQMNADERGLDHQDTKTRRRRAEPLVSWCLCGLIVRHREGH